MCLPSMVAMYSAGHLLYKILRSCFGNLHANSNADVTILLL